MTSSSESIPPAAPGMRLGSADAGTPTVEQLQRALHDSRKQLQSTRETFETAIEALRMANAALMSQNSKLQSSNEERAANNVVDVTALTEANARHKIMIGELNHRVRNMLAVVSAMANQTLAPAVEGDALETFMDRLHAMARTYKLLTETDWSHLSFRQLLLEELSAIAQPHRFSVTGPPLKLIPREALVLGMIVHEMATNAWKYGALSNDDGRVDVCWQYTDAQESAVDIRWVESGGPPAAEPRHRGFGTLMVERQLAYELKGHSSVTHAAEGWVIALHLPRLQPVHPPE